MILNLTKKQKSTDIEYVLEVQTGNRRMTERFYNDCRRYFMDSYKAVFTNITIKEDIFQQSFVKLWTEMETRKIWVGNDRRIYRNGRDGMPHLMTCSLKTFLIDIAKNDYRDWLRSDRLTLEDDFEGFAHLAEAMTQVRLDDDVEHIEEQIVADCVFGLPPRCKEILTMFYYQKMSLDEILKARGEKNISKNGLKTSKHKCMDALKGKVKEAYNRYNLKY